MEISKSVIRPRSRNQNSSWQPQPDPDIHNSARDKKNHDIATHGKEFLEAELRCALNNVSQLATDKYKLKAKHQEEIKFLQDDVKKYKLQIELATNAFNKAEKFRLEVLQKYHILQDFIANIPTKIEIQHWKYDLQEKTYKIKTLQEELQVSRAKTDELEQELCIKAEDLRFSISEIEELTYKLHKADEEVLYLKVHPHKECQSQIEIMQSKISTLESKNAKLIKIVRSVSKQYQDRKLIFGLKTADLQTQLDFHRIQNKQCGKDIEELKTNTSELQEKLKKAEELVTSSEAYMKEADVNFTASNTALQQLTDSVHSLQNLTNFYQQLLEGRNVDDSFLFKSSTTNSPNTNTEKINPGALLSSILTLNNEVKKLKRFVMNKYSDNIAHQMSSCITQ